MVSASDVQAKLVLGKPDGVPDDAHDECVHQRIELTRDGQVQMGTVLHIEVRMAHIAHAEHGQVLHKSSPVPHIDAQVELEHDDVQAHEWIEHVVLVGHVELVQVQHDDETHGALDSFLDTLEAQVEQVDFYAQVLEQHDVDDDHVEHSMQAAFAINCVYSKQVHLLPLASTP